MNKIAIFKDRIYQNILVVLVCLVFCSLVSGCQSSYGSLGESINEGAVLDPDALQLIRVGSSEKQVLLSLGTPTLQNHLNIGSAFYYISQKRYRPAAFLPAKIINRRVFTLYFDKSKRVTRIADYGLRDGRVVDFVSQETPSVYQEDNSFISKIVGTTRLTPSKSMFGL